MVIEIKNLSKSYGETVVLDSVNLTLDSARPICIMGQSGRGKTTLFNIMLGLLKADSGEITGAEAAKFSAVFQEDRLCEQLSAIMNIAQKADEENDRTTLNFIDWFIAEQIEEEEAVKNIIKRLELFGEDKVALYLMDKELSERNN